MHHVLPYSDFCLYWCLAYIREGISDLRIYVAVTSPYPRDRGVTQCPVLLPMMIHLWFLHWFFWRSMSFLASVIRLWKVHPFLWFPFFIHILIALITHMPMLPPTNRAKFELLKQRGLFKFLICWKPNKYLLCQSLLKIQLNTNPSDKISTKQRVLMSALRYLPKGFIIEHGISSRKKFGF